MYRFLKHIQFLRTNILVLLFLFFSVCKEEPEPIFQPYPLSLVGNIYVSDSYYRDSYNHYHFTTESEVIVVRQKSIPDECNFTDSNVEVWFGTYFFNRNNGRLEIYENRTTEENYRIFHFKTLEEEERLPPLELNQIYVYKPNWGSSEIEVLHINDCFSGTGRILLPDINTSGIKIQLEFSYDFNDSIPALINKCKGNPVSINRIINDSLRIEADNVYELLEMAMEEYENGG